MRRGALYSEVRNRIGIVVMATSPGDLERQVPATPAWSVRDVVAHLAGASADISAGNVEGAGSDPWTARQVSDRRSATVAELLDEWAEHSPAVEALLDEVPMAGLALADAATHEQDIAGALGLAAGRGSPANDASLQLYLGRLDERLRAAGSTLSIVTDSDEWLLGSGELRWSVRTSNYELFRAVAGRRSLNQIRSWDWAGNDQGPQQIPLLPAAKADVIEAVPAPG